MEPFVTVDFSYEDYAELLSLLSCSAYAIDVEDPNGKMLSDDFLYFVDLLNSNRR